MLRTPSASASASWKTFLLGSHSSSVDRGTMGCAAQMWGKTHWRRDSSGLPSSQAVCAGTCEKRSPMRIVDRLPRPRLFPDHFFPDSIAVPRSWVLTKATGPRRPGAPAGVGETRLGIRCSSTSLANEATRQGDRAAARCPSRVNPHRGSRQETRLAPSVLAPCAGVRGP